MERLCHFHAQKSSFQLQTAQLSVQIYFNKTSTLDETRRLFQTSKASTTTLVVTLPQHTLK